MRIEHHPKLNIWVREDGCVYIPQNGNYPAHWTFGSKNDRGYRTVRIAGKAYKVHRLAVETFIQYPIPDGYEVDHLNRNRSDNRAFENLRIVTRSENNRNTAQNDRVAERGGTHKYEDERKAHHECCAHYRKSHRDVRFADGSRHWIPNEQAVLLLAIPLSLRIYKG